jgi:ADP-ribosylglycohydrolase
MTGALAGALLGADAIPAVWLEKLESEPGSKGRSYLEQLAGKLCEAYRVKRSSRQED